MTIFFYAKTEIFHGVISKCCVFLSFLLLGLVLNTMFTEALSHLPVEFRQYRVCVLVWQRLSVCLPPAPLLEGWCELCLKNHILCTATVCLEWQDVFQVCVGNISSSLILWSLVMGSSFFFRNLVQPLKKHYYLQYIIIICPESKNISTQPIMSCRANGFLTEMGSVDFTHTLKTDCLNLRCE